MAVTFCQMNFAGQEGANPRLGRMISTDNLETILQPGYVNNSTPNDGPFLKTDFLMTSYDVDNSPSQIELSVSIAKSGVITLSSGPNGGGNVIGPTSSDDNGLPLFSGTGGNIIKQETQTGGVRVDGGIVSIYALTAVGEEFLAEATLVNQQAYLGLSGADDSLAGYGPGGTLANIGLGTGFSIDDSGDLQFSGSSSGNVIGPTPPSTVLGFAIYANDTGTLLANSLTTLDESVPNRRSIFFNLVGATTPAEIRSTLFDGMFSFGGYYADLAVLNGVNTASMQSPLTFIQGQAAGDRTICTITGTLGGQSSAVIATAGDLTISSDESAYVVQTQAGSPSTITCPDSNATSPNDIIQGFFFTVESYTDQAVNFAVQGTDTLTNPNGSTSMTGFGSVATLTLGPANMGGGKYWILSIVSVAESGGGDVVGPGSSTDNALTVWDGNTGLLVKNSIVVIDPTSGGATFNIAGVATIPELVVENSSGNSLIALTGDISGLKGVIEAGCQSPLIVNEDIGGGRTLIQQHGTMYDHNDFEGPLTANYIVTVNDSAKVFDWTNSISGTVTLPAWSAITPGFKGKIVQMSGNTMTLLPDGADVLQNVNGQTDIGNIGAILEYQATSTPGIWEVVIIDLLGSGGGDVTGPSGSINQSLALFDGTTGKIIQGVHFSPAVNTLYGDVAGTGVLQQITIDPASLEFTGNQLGVVPGGSDENMDFIVKPVSYLWGTASRQSGQVSIPNGSSELDGVLTLYNTENVQSGDTLILFPPSANPAAVIVDAVSSNIALAVTTNFIGASFTDGTYQFGPAGTVSISNGASIVTGTSTFFTQTTNSGNTFYVGSNQIAYTVLYVLSDTILVFTTSYAQATTSGVGYYTTSANTQIISNSLVRDSHTVQSSISGTFNPFNLTESRCAYKQIIFYGQPSPPSGMEVNYWIIDPTNGGYNIVDVNTAVGPALQPFFPDGNTPGQGLATWVGSSTNITGTNTFFTRLFKTGDFIILYAGGTLYYALTITAIASDTSLTVAYSNPSSNFLIKVPYMRSTYSAMGGITTSNISPVISGTLTSFLTQFRAGDAIGFNVNNSTGYQIISSVQSNTSMTLTGNAAQGVTNGAYFKLVNTATVPLLGAYPDDSIQFQEQVSGIFSPFQITASEVFNQSVTFDSTGYYPANDAFLSLWITKEFVNASGLPIASPLVPTDFSWGGLAQLDGLITPFARNATTFIGTGTHFTSQLSVGRNIIIYPIPSDPTQTPYASPFITQVASVISDTQFTVIASGPAAIQNFGYCNYALSAQGGLISNSIGTISVIGSATDFTQLSTGDIIMYTAIVGGNATVQTAIVSTVNTVNSMTIQQLPPNNFTQSPYARVTQFYTFSSPATTGGDAIFATMKSQGASTRFIQSCEAGNQEITVSLSGYQPTGGPILNIWGPRPI